MGDSYIAGGGPQNGGENELARLLEDYRRNPEANDKKVRNKIANFKNGGGQQISEEWRNFFVGVAQVAVKKDINLFKIILANTKAIADPYSKSSKKDSTLYDTIITENINESEAIDFDLFKPYSEKNEEIAADFEIVCALAISHIENAKDGAFAIAFFEHLTKGQNKGNVKIYLDKLLGIDKAETVISENVFTEEFFEKSKSGKKFAKDIKKFANDNKELDIKYETSAVWQNWTKVKAEWDRKKKKRAIIIIVSVLCAIAVLAGTFAGLYVWWNSIDKSSIEIAGRGIIYCTYGESPDLGDYSVTYRNNSGEQFETEVTPDMLTYDSETIGQQTATITYKGKTIQVTVEIAAADIDIPVLTQSGNSISWRSVEHAKEYNIYKTASSTADADTVYATITNTSYDFSEDGDLSGTFYIYVIAVSESGKYNNSAKSDRLELTKLAAVNTSSVTYKDGCITWDAVDGADHYMLTYNGTSVQNIKATSYEVELSGDITISVNAYSADSSVISSVGTEVKLTKLSKVTSAEYSETTATDGSTVSRITWTASEECYYIYSIDDGDYSTTAQLANYIDVSALDAGVHSVSIICYPMYSGQVQSDAVTYKFSINSNISVSPDGIISWDKIGSTYNIYVDGDLFRSNLTVESFSLSSVNLSAGDHTITIIADGDIYGKTLTFTQLAVPQLTVSGGTAFSVSGATAYTVYTCNGITYTDIDGLSSAVNSASGDYVITVQNISTSENVISSSSASVTITKLATPVLSVSGGEIVSAGADLQFYEGTNRVSVDDLTAGSHTLTAKSLGTGDYVFDSELSEAITVTKLSAPVLSYDTTTATLSVTNELGYTIRYYVDGEVYSGTVANLINSLSSGSHEITARYIGDDTSVISSSLSNTITVLQTDTKLDVTDNSDHRVSVVLRNMEDGLQYSLTVYFYDESGNLIDTLNKDGETASYQLISCNRNAGKAYSVTVVVTFTSQTESGSSTYTLSGTTTISWN